MTKLGYLCIHCCYSYTSIGKLSVLRLVGHTCTGRGAAGTASRRYKGANKPRGVSNRNAGLKWLKVHAKEGVIYFADDDNTYDYRIFQEVSYLLHFWLKVKLV